MIHHFPEKLVMDCSVTMAWCFENEATPLTENLLDNLHQISIAVPLIWSLEVINVLLMAERTKRINSIKAIEFIDFLNTLSIEQEPSTTTSLFSTTIFEIAKESKLSAYDAAYLELAMRQDVPLCTFDKALKTAAKKFNVTILQ